MGCLNENQNCVCRRCARSMLHNVSVFLKVNLAEMIGFDHPSLLVRWFRLGFNLMSSNIIVKMVVNEAVSLCIAVHQRAPMHVSHSHTFPILETHGTLFCELLIMSFSKSAHEKTPGIVGPSLA